MIDFLSKEELWLQVGREGSTRGGPRRQPFYLKAKERDLRKNQA